MITHKKGTPLARDKEWWHDTWECYACGEHFTLEVGDGLPHEPGLRPAYEVGTISYPLMYCGTCKAYTKHKRLPPPGESNPVPRGVTYPSWWQVLALIVAAGLVGWVFNVLFELWIG